MLRINSTKVMTSQRGGANATPRSTTHADADNDGERHPTEGEREGADALDSKAGTLITA